MAKKNNDINIILVDDNKVFRSVLSKFLQNEFNFNIIGEASSSVEFFEFKNITLADVILMDLQIPETDGFAITKKLIMDFRDVKVMAITMHSEMAYLQELINVGFRGCVFKTEVFQKIEDAIQCVVGGKYYFPAGIKIDNKQSKID
jgi:DNA-binding NarL/FixJ family response regulator